MGLLMVPVGFEHGKYQIELAMICRKIYTEFEWTGPVTLPFEDKTNPEPDIIGWRDGNPWVVIEISYTTQKADLGYKKLAYEANGIPFYVVFDVREKTLFTWGLVNGSYESDPVYLKQLRAAVEAR